MRVLAASILAVLTLGSAPALADLPPPETPCADEGESCRNMYDEEGVCIDGQCQRPESPEPAPSTGGCASCAVGDQDTVAGVAALGLYLLAAAAGGRRRRSPRN